MKLLEFINVNNVIKPNKIMKNFFEKNATITILGIITVVELIATKSMQGSFILWLAYGFYKILKHIDD